MNSVDVALARVWPSEMCTDRLVLRPVAPEDATVVGELLTDTRVRAFLGGPVPEERVVARQRAYPATPGAWAVVLASGGQVVGLVTIGPDHRCEGRAELSYQMLPSAWGQGLGREAVGAALGWWTTAVPDGGPIVAVTQHANASSRRLLESLGMVLIDEFEEFEEQQCLYTPGGAEDDAELRWARLVGAHLDQVERRRGAQARATVAGSSLPEDLTVLGPEELARLCPARHGAYGRVCAHTVGHAPDLHLGRAPDGAWIAWLGSAEE
ncbi:GNAT family N-acetyltransferase [Streptomyces sp. NBC_01601]|uniref:GNAT family N-acetyltransferase n=1 Tax=Streptomyces sp. NBC_01601 TaxID=2975892 RepID=UPI002E2BD3AF|nr:GNAT family N-acetyltransferase [Streptomyces sp. NBC_01601]